MSRIEDVRVPDIGDFKYVEIIEVAVKPGDVLMLKGWSKVSNANAGASLGLSFFDSSQTSQLPNAGAAVQVTALGYTEYQMTNIQAPDKAYYALVWGWKQGTSSNLFADDFCLTMGGTAPTPTPTATAPTTTRCCPATSSNWACGWRASA